MESASQRVPISCENCRQRKIRCVNSDEHAPCGTCVRRGYASTCHFRRESVLSHRQSPDGNLDGSFSELAELLRQNISLTTAALAHKQNTPALSSQPSTTAVPVSPPQATGDINKRYHSGQLVASGSNHVRYVPFERTGSADLLETMREPELNTFISFPLSAGGPCLVEEILEELPPFQICDELKRIFMEVFSPLFHIIHEPRFEARYREFKSRPRSTPPSFIALLFVIFSLSVTSLDVEHPLVSQLGQTSTPASNLSELAASYRSSAMRCLAADNFMVQHNLGTLQCLLLLIYALSHVGGSTWSLLGTTLHIAIAIGCSIDPDHLKVDMIEAEERRRSWAALTMLYTIQSSCFGNILPFRIQADVTLPADLNDDQLSEASPHCTQSSPGRLTQMTYLLCKFRLYNIAFDICQQSSTLQPPPRELAVQLDQKLSMELRGHLSIFESVSSMPFSQVAQFYIATNYTHALILLLHRPYIRPTKSASARQFTAAHIRESYQRSNDSAMKILSNFESFYQNDSLKPYHWYLNGVGAFQSFLAITTLLSLMKKEYSSPTSNLAIQIAINTSLNIFRAMRFQSEICVKALAVIEPVIQPIVSGHQPTVFGEASLAIPPSIQSCSSAAVWNEVLELDSLINDIPSEQWLLPSAFPWPSTI